MLPVDCRINIPEVSGLEDNKMTVGRKFNLNCIGEYDSQFDFSKANIKNESLEVKFFGAKAVNASEFDAVFTLYKAGEHQLSQLVLTDGLVDIQLKAPSVIVESVLVPTTDGKPQEPYGPIFPVKIAVPFLYFVIIASAFLSILAYSLFRTRKIVYYNGLRSRLKQYDSPVEPDTQFYKSLRSSEKSDYPVELIEKAFKLYNLRAYKIPLFDLSNSKAIKYFKYQHPQLKETRMALHRLLEEMEELKSRETLSVDEKRDFIKKLYRYVDQNKGLP